MNPSLPWNNSTNASTIHVSRKGTILVVVESFVFLVLNIAALVGNLLVCVAFYRNPSLRTVTNNFTLSLALADLLVAVFVMPQFTASSFANRWIAGNIGLTLAFYIHYIAVGISLLTVMLVAINRYFRVVKPDWYRKIYSKKSSSVMAATSWIVTALLTLFSFASLGINYKINEFNPTSPTLSLPNRTAYIYYNIPFNLYLIFPSLVIALCYVKIYQTIRQHNMAAAPSSQEENSSYGVEEAKMTRLLTAVVVGFYLCWFPFAIAVFLEAINLLKPEDKYRSFLMDIPVYSSSVINPMVYGVMNRSFRSEFFKIIRCRWFQKLR